jgi:hypothetical protein
VSERELDEESSSEEKKKQIDKYAGEVERSKPKQARKLEIRPATTPYWLRLTQEASLAMGFLIIIEIGAILIVTFDLARSLGISVLDLPREKLLQSGAPITTVFAIIGTVLSLFFSFSSFKVGRIYGAGWLQIAAVFWVFSSVLAMVLALSTTNAPFAFGITVTAAPLDPAATTIADILIEVIWIVSFALLALGSLSMDHQTETGQFIFVGALMLIGILIRPVIPVAFIGLGMVLGSLMSGEEKHTRPLGL